MKSPLTSPLLHTSTGAPASALAFPDSTAHRELLPNGLNILVLEDHSAPVASVQVWIATGSIHEDRLLGSGMSHLLEHMAFKGTSTRGANAIANAIQDEGGYINAYTSFDRTVYWVDVPATGVRPCLEILTDAALNSTLPADEYVKEQEVIRREFAMLADDPDRVNSQLLFATAYREHPYRHPIIGHLPMFNALTRDEVMGYYKTRYVPNNMTVVVAGDVRTDEVICWVRELFSGQDARSLPPVYLPQEPTQRGRREASVEHATELSRVIAAWHVPEITHEDVPALDVLATALGDGRSSRLFRRVRETGLAHGASAWSYVPSEPGLFGLDLTTDPEQREKALAAAFAVLEEVRQQGLGAAELAKARKVILSNQLHTLATMRGQASDLGANWMLTGNLNFTRDFLRAIDAVTNDDILRVARRHLQDDNLTLTSVNPPGSRKTVVAGAKRTEAEIQLFTLPNGLRLLVKEDPRLPLVSMNAVFRGGLLTESPETAGLSKLLARVLPKGTTTRSGDELAELVESVGGSYGADAGNNSVSVAVEVLQADVALGLDVLADVVLRAALPEEQIERERAIQLAAIKSEDEHMTAAARNLLRSHLFVGHPFALRATGSRESVAGLRREQLVAVRDRLFVGRNGIVSVFGAVRADEVKAQVEALFGAMPAGEPALTQPPQPTVPAGSATYQETKQDKEQAVIMTGFQTCDLLHEDRLALDVIDEACGDLGSRFFIKIREELGLAYFVGSMQLLGLAPGALIFYLGTDPAKLDTVRPVFETEIAALGREGLNEDEFRRAKTKLLGKQAIGLQSAAALAFHCALDELYGRGYAHYRRLVPELEALTIERVQEVARKYLDGRPSVTAIVQPA
ncbi:MAG: insulinase family protein [Verrucomicrobia bacterium]|nr:insulinase family protein [Verrucomicrobiota bacterium]